MKKGTVLIYGSILSVLLLLVLGILQIKEAKVLELPPQWLAIAVLPIIISLFISGFLSRFKGFGLEIEGTLQEPVTSLHLTALDAVADIPGGEKQSIMKLEGMTYQKKFATRWLHFKSGRQGYYELSAIEKYLRELPNIEYLEIRSESDDIICFIPIDVFRDATMRQDDVRIDHENIQRLVQAIEQNNVPSAFAGLAVTLKVKSDQSLIDVLKLMKSEKAEFAAVTSPSGKYLGVVFANEIERRIASAVLTASAA